MVVDKHFIYNFAQTWKEPQCPQWVTGYAVAQPDNRMVFSAFATKSWKDLEEYEMHVTQ